ncbi:MAG: hypothetical protein JOY58_04795 [Solirubrobacterales bacterium]|nr:hypothetical protein [Solirubrobacterales bacterium]
MAATSLTLLLGAVLALPGMAQAAQSTASASTSTTPVLVTSQSKSPLGYRLTAAEVERIAAAAPTIRAELRRHPRLVPYEYTKGSGQWQVSWFTPGTEQRELAQVYVDDATGKVTEAWTGFQVAWTMARGYPGAFGRRLNAWWIWVPLSLLFIAPFLPWRDGVGALLPWRRGRRGWSLWHLDLLMLLGFSVSLAFFNHGQIGLSVPIVYPFLVYLALRMLLLAFGRGIPRKPLRIAIPLSWLLVGVVFLVGFRIGLNIANSNVIDVGYAGVIGADKVIHGQHLYGNWPHDNSQGDTYGPVVYYAYVPFRAIFGWSGTWDQLPAAHAAAIVFDLLTLLGLYWLGRRVRGPTGGAVLAYLWVAYPFTLWTLCSNTNDSLVAMLLVLALLVVSSAPARGVAAALAGLTKLAPLALAPLLMRGTGGWPRKRSLVAYLLAYGATLLAAMLPVLLSDNFHAFWHDSISYQAGRVTPFSVWGLWGGLRLEQHLVEAASVALAVLVAFFPRRRGVAQMSALAAAVLIMLQVSANYWLYSYIVWFFPLVIVALLAMHPVEPEASDELSVERWESAPQPAFREAVAG